MKASSYCTSKFKFMLDDNASIEKLTKSFKSVFQNFVVYELDDDGYYRVEVVDVALIDVVDPLYRIGCKFKVDFEVERGVLYFDRDE